jgi:hypothetical protein
VSSGTVRCKNNIFQTPVGTGSGQVTQAFFAGGGDTRVTDNKTEGAGLFAGGSGFAGYAVRNEPYNPVGPLAAPGVPLTTVALQNPFGTDCTVIITAGTAAVTVGIGLTSSTTNVVTIPASAVCSVRLSYQEYIKLTYSSGSPSWGWTGD